jgi:hypothetical protein
MGPVSGVPPASPGPARVLAFQLYVIAVQFHADREMLTTWPAVQDCIGRELGRDKHHVISNRAFTQMLSYVTADMAHLISLAGVGSLIFCFRFRRSSYSWRLSCGYGSHRWLFLMRDGGRDLLPKLAGQWQNRE